MLKLLKYEAVEYRHWIENEEFLSMLSSSFLFPGLTAVKLTALIGYKAGGLLGLLLAVLCLNLPGLIMALLGYQWLISHSGPYTRKIMIAVQYGALALLAAATYSVAQGVVNMHYSIPVILLTFLFFLSLTFWNVSPFFGFIIFIIFCSLLAS